MKQAAKQVKKGLAALMAAVMVLAIVPAAAVRAEMLDLQQIEGYLLIGGTPDRDSGVILYAFIVDNEPEIEAYSISIPVGTTVHTFIHPQANGNWFIFAPGADSVFITSSASPAAAESGYVEDSFVFENAGTYMILFQCMAGGSSTQWHIQVVAQMTETQAPPLLGRVVILDAGHGLGTDSVFMGYSEQATMLRLALMIKPMLQELGATVHLTRSTPEDVPLHTRPALINKWTLQALRAISGCAAEIAEIDRLISVMGLIINNPQRYAPIYMNAPFDWSRRRTLHPDMRQIFYLQNNPIIYQNFLAISLHSNAMPPPVDTSVNGADVYIISNTTYYNINYFSGYTNVERSRLFADLLLDRIDALGIRRRQINDHNAFVMIREHNIPAVLAENGFHTNPSDRAKLMCDIFLQNLAVGYVESIVAYFFNRLQLVTG